MPKKRKLAPTTRLRRSQRRTEELRKQIAKLNDTAMDDVVDKMDAKLNSTGENLSDAANTIERLNAALATANAKLRPEDRVAVAGKVPNAKPEPAEPPAVRKPIEQILKEMRLVTESQVQEAMAIQRQEGDTIDAILVKLNYITAQEALQAMHIQAGTDVPATDTKPPATPAQ